MRNLIFGLNNYIYLLDTDCVSILGPRLIELLDKVFLMIKIAVPIVVLVLVMVDLLSAVTSGDDKTMKSAQGRAIKRIIIGLIIFFIPTIVNLIFSFVGITNGTCGIG